MRNNLLALSVVVCLIALVGSLAPRARHAPLQLSAGKDAGPPTTVEAPQLSLHGLHLGMTEAEARAVLQRKSTHRFEVPKFSSHELTWQYPDWMVSAMFQNGRIKQMSGYHSELRVGSRAFACGSSFDALDRELGPGAPLGPGAGGWVSYPRYHLKVAYNGDTRTISGFSVGAWGLNAGTAGNITR